MSSSLLHTMQIGCVTSDVQRALTYKAMAASSATYVSRRSPLAQVMSEPHVQIKADGSEQKRKQKESVSGFHEGILQTLTHYHLKLFGSLNITRNRPL